ncbi:MAG: BlaI/MecI/CopY family transcriptional regulator [candidate division KSB1 bacterium]|nr:BlaI/MecI/CopY family transcriptional regulator [candidate division KSB1 bacterium]MDZ7334248.1 BlaI/MecI/CopY family transcriptional regulator [candidate division KSB1 bacterium]MDZ7356354.1 BlaI/MecI/CopY family transcriptional regulator [candidate division KSB1 bacterium]MDZ7375447.1 BlaI/MecI/CopY family transcriptional regulator [candidate division KSB1 bacterium]MDZ7401046.1 BlaI/MecI/CopY family transcriptional regulator [candidate division KSB1 bacterium]
MKNQMNLSELEWQIMQVLWQKGVMSVREVWETLFPEAEKAYTTVQTYMDRMVEKGLLRKQKLGLVNYYHAAVDKNFLRQNATEYLVSQAFEGSFFRLAAFLLESTKLSQEELDQIKQLIRAREED